MNRQALRLTLLSAVFVVGTLSKAQAEQSWVMPRPPVSAAARLKNEGGTVKLKLTTNAAGKVVKVVASVPAKQKDVPELAQPAVKWALTYWSGPPNSTTQTELRFVLH